MFTFLFHNLCKTNIILNTQNQLLGIMSKYVNVPLYNSKKLWYSCA